MAYSGNKIVHLLKERGIKAKEFFEYVYPGRSGNSSFHDIERNDNPSARAIERIADLLDCTIDELFGREPAAGEGGDHIEADHNSTAFKGTNTCDQRLLSMIETRDRQLDKAQEQLDRAQQQSDRLLALLESAARN